jgi:flagellar capping protein FliD
VVKKQNEIIREKKEQDRLNRDIESITKESDDLKKSLGQAEKRLTDHRTSTKDQERLLR